MHPANTWFPGFALEMIVKSILVLAVVLLLAWSMRRFSAATRHLCLAAAAVALLALPVASALLPSWQLLELPAPLVSALEPASSDAAAMRASAEESPAARRSVRAASPGAGSSPAAEGGRPGWLSWILLTWGTGAAILLTRLVGGKLYGQWIVSKATPAGDRRLVVAVGRVAERFGIARPPAVVESDHMKVPFVWGLFRPRLVLPSGAADWPAERVEAVVRHELAHVKRRDLLLQFLAQVACCLYWINPLVWILERRLFIERERACDDLAIGREAKASDYAGHLMEIVEELGPARNRVWVVSAMAEGTDFKDRIVSVLDPAAKRTAPKLGHTAAVITVSALLVLSLSSVRPLSGATTAPQAAARPADDDRALVASTRPQRAKEPVDDSLVEGLIASLEVNDASIRRHAAEALGRQGDARALPALIDALGDRDASVREHVATALGQIGDTRAIVPLTDALGDEDARVREHAASALGKIRNAAAAPPLSRLVLSDEQARVREHAASALGEIGDATAAPPLGRALLEDPDARVREHVASALGRIGDRTAIPPLIRALREDVDEDVREHVATALGHAGKGDDGAYRALVEAFRNDESIAVRAHAAYGLGLLGDRRAFELLVGGLDSPHVEIRAHCAEGLGWLGDSRALPYLQEAANDENERVRERAQRGLRLLLDSL